MAVSNDPNAVLDRPVVADDLYGADYFRDPHPYWARMRLEQPVFFDSISSSWVLTRFADVDAIFRDHERYSNRTYTASTGAVFGTTLLEMDGHDHVVRRTIVAPDFVGKRLDAFVDVIDRNIEDLIEPWRADGRVDLVDRFTTRLPINVIVDMLALRKEDHELFHDWYSSMMAGLSGVPALRERGRNAHAGVSAYIDPYLVERMGCPGPDLLSKIAHGEAEGQRLTDAEVKSFVSLMFVAGGETSDKAISNLWWNLLTHPDALGAVTADPSLLDAAFSESMRKDGPVQFEARFTTADVEWYGTTIPKGALVRVCVASANSDETVFASPRSFAIDRGDLHLGLERRAGVADGERTGHLGFGVGKHFCLGYELARTEAVRGSRRLLEVMTNPRIAPGTDPWPTFKGGFRAITTLVVDYDPA